MTIRRENWERLTLAEMKAFVENNRKVRFKAKAQEEAYRIIEAVLKEQGYRRLSKGAEGNRTATLGQDHGAEPSALAAVCAPLHDRRYRGAGGGG